MQEQISSRTRELRSKVCQLSDWEKEMRSLLDDFDFYLGQVNEIENFNQNTIEKIHREMCSENRGKFNTIVESQRSLIELE